MYKYRKLYVVFHHDQLHFGEILAATTKGTAEHINLLQHHFGSQQTHLPFVNNHDCWSKNSIIHLHSLLHLLHLMGGVEQQRSTWILNTCWRPVQGLREGRSVSELVLYLAKHAYVTVKYECCWLQAEYHCMNALYLCSVAGNVLLTSTVEEDGRWFPCEGEMVTFICDVIGSLSLQWDSQRIRQDPIIFSIDPAAPVVVSRSSFIATITSIARSGSSSNSTSTLQVNALRTFARNDTTVECRNWLGVNESSRFTVAGISVINISKFTLPYSGCYLIVVSSLSV